MSVLWQRQWLDNYHGRSEEAKGLKTDVKANYKGNQYIPWATMERLLLTQDPEFKIEKITNKDGGLLHSESFEIEQYTQDGAAVKHTKAMSFIHFVKIKVVFLGKEIIEDYPIQDNEYKAPKALDQNLVNKALQRGFAKAASRASGLGFTLYESLDLQFDDNEPQAVQGVKKTTVTKKEKPVVKQAEPKVEPKQEVKEVEKPEPKVEEDKQVEEVKQVEAKVEEVKVESKQEVPVQVVSNDASIYDQMRDIYNKLSEEVRVGTIRKVNQVLINAKAEVQIDVNGDVESFINSVSTLDQNIQNNLLKYIKTNLEQGKVV